ncbi:maleylacetoacetate isomerase [Sarocladium strictum]
MPDYTLYSYFRSSCTARVRIALHLKGISYEEIPRNLLKGEQQSEAHRALNPSGTVPLLICHAAGDMKITQSCAAVEYINEVHAGTGPDLLPPTSNPAARAASRALASIVAADIQPLTNLKLRKYIKEMASEEEATKWNIKATVDGLQAYETVAAQWAGKFSVGDELSLADCCLMPAVWNADRLEIDIGQFPTISKIVKNLNEVPAVQQASYFRQKDCPPELRAKE